MQDSTFLPELRVFPTERLLPHEEFDPRRIERLAKRLCEDGILKHPPIVTQIPCQEEYVILDGANRVMAFKHLGIPHIVAQLVEYNQPGLTLDTWYHVVAGMPLDQFNQELKRVTGMNLIPCPLTEARLALASQDAAAYIVCEAGVRKVCNSKIKCEPDIGLLNRLVWTYKGQANIFRASNDIWEIQKPYYPDITALVIFPRLTPDDIIHAACSGEKLPTGISRHVIPARALNTNIPIAAMDNDWAKEKKDDWLHDWLMERMAANSIRYYAESTFSFNE
jgi:L-serine kinase (ATP) / ParB family transcriptional regulator, heme-responsive regulator